METLGSHFLRSEPRLVVKCFMSQLSGFLLTNEHILAQISREVSFSLYRSKQTSCVFQTAGMKEQMSSTAYLQLIQKHINNWRVLEQGAVSAQHDQIWKL